LEKKAKEVLELPNSLYLAYSAGRGKFLRSWFPILRQKI